MEVKKEMASETRGGKSTFVVTPETEKWIVKKCIEELLRKETSKRGRTRMAEYFGLIWRSRGRL
jgi:hypothetical protein